MRRDLEPAYAMAYAHFLPIIQKIGREHGYAIALHGSMRTDIDLLACPWTEEASTADILISAILEGTGAFVSQRELSRFPVYQPHGRMTWSVFFDEKSARTCIGPYMDISVMPLLPAESDDCPTCGASRWP